MPAALLNRVGIYGTVQQSYFFFKHLLPVVNPGTLDQQLTAASRASVAAGASA